ncbi:MAG: alpha/beta hydrolase [Candidatus Omnitrophica bacterium]|nr:alpha/beta hydrolase [Candidatus Omnitrophota bacterium]MCM8801725.1 alpha/beta hydrolase [Candidatus Omnitrophota bacterium]
MENLINIYNKIYKVIKDEFEFENQIKRIYLFNEIRKVAFLSLPPHCTSLLIILPGAGFNKKTERLLYKNFQYLLKDNIGICIYILNDGNLNKEDYIFFEYFKEKIGEIRGLVKYIKDELKIRDINLLGISFGGIIGFIVTALEKDIKKSIFFISGVNLEFITWRSLLRFKLKKECKRNVCKKMHKIYKNLIKNNLYDEILNLPKKCFLYEPLTYINNLRDRKILMINGIFDMIVPFYCALEVKKWLKNIKILWYPSTHLTFKFFFPIVKKRVLNFLKNENIHRN